MTHTDEPQYLAGVDLGGRNVMAAIVKPDGEIVARAKKKSKGKRGPQEITDLCCQAVLKAIEEAQAPKEQIKGVGIGAPGTIDGELAGRLAGTGTSRAHHCRVRRGGNSELLGLFGASLLPGHGYTVLWSWAG